MEAGDPARQLDALDLDNGTTCFMFLATALVQFMTPGLGFFYAGMVGSRSTVAVMFQSFICLGTVFCVWVLVAFSLTFGEPWLCVFGYKLLGNPSTYFMLRNVNIYEPLQRASTIVAAGFPGMLFMAYQGMFAVITPALISGAFVDRMKFSTYTVFTAVWLLFVYAPLGYWNWGGGWMFDLGAWDFAGGMVVHESAGFSALGALLVTGSRAQPPPGVAQDPSPHSIPWVVVGTSMLWFGWFGFNGGSALTIGGLATIAFVNSQIAPAAGMVFWMLLDWLSFGKPTLMGACSGAVAGLVVITPGAGFMQPGMALLAGFAAGTMCWVASKLVKRAGIDDTCDTIGVHGFGGFIGTIFVGTLSDPPICQGDAPPEWCANPGTVARSWDQFRIQTICGVSAAVFSTVMTMIIVKTLSMVHHPLLLTYEEQESARDEASFGEVAYKLPGVTVPKAPLMPEGKGKDLEDHEENEISAESEADEASGGSARILLMASSLFAR